MRLNAFLLCRDHSYKPMKKKHWPIKNFVVSKGVHDPFVKFAPAPAVFYYVASTEAIFNDLLNLFHLQRVYDRSFLFLARKNRERKYTS